MGMNAKERVFGWAAMAALAAYLLALASAKFFGYMTMDAGMHPYMHSLLFALRAYRGALPYCMQFAVALSMGVLLWKLPGNSWRWFFVLCGAVLLMEIAKPIVQKGYFEVLAILATALGLLSGRLWNAMLDRSAGRKKVLGAFFAVGTAVALLAEN